MAFLSIRPMAKANFYEMMQHGEGCDLSIATSSGSEKYKIHSIVWLSIVKSNFKEENGLVIFEFSDEILREIIKFAYTGNYNLSQENYQETMDAASVYGITQLQRIILRNLSSLEEKENSKTYQHILTIGGWAEGPTSITEIYDVRKKAWSFAKGDNWNRKFPFPSILYHSIEVLSNSIFMIGGCSDPMDGPQVYLDTCYQFDLDSNCWKKKSSMDSKRCYVATTVLDGKIYALGGHNGTAAIRLRTCECYDPSRNQWDDIADMRHSRSDFAAVTITDSSKILAIGGFNGEEYLSSIEMFDPETNTWELIGNMTTPRSGLSAEVIGDKVFCIGGFDGHERLTSVECFTIGQISNRLFWHHVPSMTVPRSNFATSLVNDGCDIMAVGGFRDDALHRGVSSVVEILNVKENLWEEGPALNTARSALACCTLFTVEESGLF